MDANENILWFKDEIKKNRERAHETRILLSDHDEQERMVVAAFLRCIGISFSVGELTKLKQDNIVDVEFNNAQFQVMSIVAGRKIGDEWREREEGYCKLYEEICEVEVCGDEDAKEQFYQNIISDPNFGYIEKYQHSKQVSFREISGCISESLKAKSRHYGYDGCSSLDALVYVNIPKCHLYPPEPNIDEHEELVAQGWRSVSMIFGRYGSVLIANGNGNGHGNGNGPDFIRERKGRVLSEWPYPDGLFNLRDDTDHLTRA